MTTNNIATQTSLSLPGATEWYDSGIAVTLGEKVVITASGQVYVGDVSAGQPSLSNYETPAGASNTTTSAQDAGGAFAAPGLVPWSLVGKIGGNGSPFEIGVSKTLTTTGSGDLYLSVNDNNFGDNSGSWNVSVETFPLSTQTEITLSTAGDTVTYTIDGAAVAVDPKLSVSDTSATDLTGASVAISQGFLSGDTLDFANQNGISGSFDNTTGVLTLSGTASLADYQTALDSVTFSSSASDPTASGADNTRTITWTASDATGSSQPVTSTIDIRSQMTVTAPASEQATVGVPISVSGIGVSDPNAQSVTVTISDQSGALSTTAVSGGSTVSGAGTTILTVSGSVAAVNASLSKVTYDGPIGTTAADTIDLTATDNFGTSSDKQIKIDVNQLPDKTIPDLSLSDGGNFVNNMMNWIQNGWIGIGNLFNPNWTGTTEWTTDFAASDPSTSVVVDPNNSNYIDISINLPMNFEVQNPTNGFILTKQDIINTEDSILNQLTSLGMTVNSSDIYMFVDNGQLVNTSKLNDAIQAISLSGSAIAQGGNITSAIEISGLSGAAFAGSAEFLQQFSDPTAIFTGVADAYYSATNNIISMADNANDQTILSSFDSNSGTSGALTITNGQALQISVKNVQYQDGSQIKESINPNIDLHFGGNNFFQHVTITPSLTLDIPAVNTPQSSGESKDIQSFMGASGTPINLYNQNTGNGSHTAINGDFNAYVVDPNGTYSLPTGFQAGFLEPGVGNATLIANSGNDLLMASPASGSTDALVAGTGNDMLVGVGGANTFYLGTGSDTVFGGTGSNTIIGSPQNSGNDTIGIPNGGTLNDTAADTALKVPVIFSDNGTLAATSGTTFDVSGAVTGGGTLSLDGNIDMPDFSDSGDVFANGSADTIGALAKHIYVTTSPSTALTFLGDMGAATVFGQGGGLFEGGTGGDNVLVADGGNSTILGSTGGGDSLVGAQGNVMIAATPNDTVFAATNGGDDTVFGTASGSDVLVGGNGGAATLVGSTGNDAMWGGTGPDVLFGGTGNETLGGGTGNTTVVAGTGASTLVGGSGNQEFVGAASGQATAFSGIGDATLFTGGETMTVVLQNSTPAIDTIVLQSGNATIWAANGANPGTDVFDVIDGTAGGKDLVVGFKPGQDAVNLYGYQTGGAHFASASGGTALTLPDGTAITFIGLSASQVAESLHYG